MTLELMAALVICLLAPLNAIISATANGFIMGFGWGLGNREQSPTLPHWATRLARSHANLMENLPSFVGVVLIAHVLQVNDQYTELSAWGFVIARILFTVTYTLGITLGFVRTLLYFASLAFLTTIAVRVALSTLVV